MTLNRVAEIAPLGMAYLGIAVMLWRQRSER